jgi:PEGA domain-containing protein
MAMSPRRLLLLGFLCLAYAPAAWPAGEESDDLLAPLTPSEGKGKVKKKKKGAPPNAPVGEKKQAPVEPLSTLAMGKLSVRLPDPSLRNARLYVDDKEIGVLPQEPVEVGPGDHKVMVKRLGYAPFNATVKVKDSGVTDLLATLEPLAAVVSFSSDIVGVEAFVDGKSYGPVPVNDVVMSPGSHQFRGKKDGYDEQNQTMAVRAGQDYAVRFSLRVASVARADRPERAKSLEPKPTAPDTRAGMSSAVVEREEGGGTPFYGQWYFWAGAGAVVAAGAAGGTVWAMQPRNPCGSKNCDACINAPPNLQQYCSGLMHLPLYIGIGVPMSSPAHH